MIFCVLSCGICQTLKSFRSDVTNLVWQCEYQDLLCLFYIKRFDKPIIAPSWKKSFVSSSLGAGIISYWYINHASDPVHGENNPFHMHSFMFRASFGAHIHCKYPGVNLRPPVLWEVHSKLVIISTPISFGFIPLSYQPVLNLTPKSIKLTPTVVEINTNLVWTSNKTRDVKYKTRVFCSVWNTFSDYLGQWREHQLAKTLRYNHSKSTMGSNINFMQMVQKSSNESR